MHAQSYWLPKAGNTATEYEDACCFDLEKRIFAIADGATESSFAGIWARLLVEDFVQNPIPGRIRKWSTRLVSLQQQWIKQTGNSALAWYAEAKREEGAAATFLGLVFEESSFLYFPPFYRRKRWRALAVGDCCLFQVRNHKVITTFPIKSSTEFGSTPWLVNSQSPVRESINYTTCAKRTGDWRNQDQFWLMTDALAQWFLQQQEQGGSGVNQVETLLRLPEQEQQARFSEWIAGLRDNKDIRNDDVTLLAVEV